MLWEDRAETNVYLLRILFGLFKNGPGREWAALSFLFWYTWEGRSIGDVHIGLHFNHGAVRVHQVAEVWDGFVVVIGRATLPAQQLLLRHSVDVLNSNHRCWSIVVQRRGKRW